MNNSIAFEPRASMGYQLLLLQGLSIVGRLQDLDLVEKSQHAAQAATQPRIGERAEYLRVGR